MLSATLRREGLVGTIAAGVQSPRRGSSGPAAPTSTVSETKASPRPVPISHDRMWKLIPASIIEVAVVPKPGDCIAAGPGRRHADPDRITAMVAPIVAEPGGVDDGLPGRVDLARPRARPQRRQHRVERRGRRFRHRRVGRRDAADPHQPPERRVVARHAARQLEKHRLVVAEAVRRPRSCAPRRSAPPAG